MISTDTTSSPSSTFESTTSPSTSTNISDSSTPTSITQTTLISTDTSSPPSSTFESTTSPSTSTNISDSSTPTSITQTTLTSTTSSTVQSSTSTKVSQSITSTTFQSTTINSTSTIAPTSTLSIGDITSPFWVRTVCNITILTDINTTQFKSDIESKLSNAYAIAYNSIQTNGRRKRAATNGTNILQLVNVARITNGQVPTNLVYYIVTSDKSFLAPSTVISNMNQLSLQQMSIYLGLPVTTVATYYNSATQNPSIDEKVWIIGAVFGSLGTMALIIWLVLFVYSRCIRPWDEPLVIKSSLDDKDSRDYVGCSTSVNWNEKTTIPMVGTIDTKNSITENKSGIIVKENKKEVKDEEILNSKTKHEDIAIVNETGKKTKKKKKHKRYKNDNEYVERENSQIENKPINEIVIRHVFEENRRKHRQKHSSTSSSDSDMSSHQKSKKKAKSKKIKIKNNSKKKKNKVNYNEKLKNKRSSDEIREKTEISEERFASSTTDIPMVFQTNDEISEEINYGEASVQEKGAAFRQINKKELTKVEGDYVSANDHFQSHKPPEKPNINLIEVQPKAISTEDISKYEIIESTSMFNNYDHLRILPSYSNEIFLEPGPSLNLVTLNTSNNLEDERLEMKQLKSNKKNLRTLNPLPREFTKKS